MNKITMLAAVAVCLGAAAPALADYVGIGSVDVNRGDDSDLLYSQFGGRVESLSFTADHGDIFCRSITVRYTDGRVDTPVADRMLEDGRPVTVDVPGRAKRVESIDFLCRAKHHRGRILIGAEVGRHLDEWRHDSGWRDHWSGLFGGGDQPPPQGGNGYPPPPNGGWHGGPDDWRVLERLSFEGSNDREQAFGGWGGMNVDRIALRALNQTARCNSVVAIFRDGSRAKLTKNKRLDQGEVSEFDLPGGHRDIDQLALRCHAFGDGQVTIEILVHR
jgi:hypothetical protein